MPTHNFFFKIVRNIFHSNTAVAVKCWEDKHSKALIDVNCFRRKLHRR